jgi:hypothetical protein
MKEKMKTYNLIYVGQRFYEQSGAMMSSLYSDDGFRWDWGLVQSTLRYGDNVNIRPASQNEILFYEEKLKAMS